MLRKPDDQALDHMARSGWTQREIDMLHDMVRDYDRARWLRGQMKWWAIWLLGVPTAGVTLWKSIEELVRLARGH